MTEHLSEQNDQQVLKILAQQIAELVIERAELQVVVELQANRLADLERALIELAKTVIESSDD